MYQKIVDEVRSFADPKFAAWVKPFLSINEYSEEVVLGVRVPILRRLAKKYSNISHTDLERFLRSEIHEIRELAIFIMILRVKKEPEKICKMYLSNLEYINNWDLIDYSAPHIVAPNVSEDVLRSLAKEDYLWANRVAMVATIYHIKQNNYALAIEFAEMYITHSHHLMHKAAGWMLREIGKRDVDVLKSFLKKHSLKMPSVMRSYAMEKIKHL